MHRAILRLLPGEVGTVPVWHVDNPNAGQTVDDFAFVCDAAGDSTLYP